MLLYDDSDEAGDESAIRPATEKALDWWRGAVIYQVYPRSFADSNGDGTGDLDGITSRLDYVAGLGVDAIWISPFFRSPMRDFGYDVSDYRDVDPVFGTLADFDRLLAGAHRRGLRVILDQVMSHTSDEHPWFRESRQGRSNHRADWYVWADPRPDGTPPNNWLSVFGGSAWQWEPRRGQYYLHNFLASQPDLNYHHPAVADQMLEEAGFWLKRGVDGFRLDAINYCFHDRLLRNNPPKAPELRRGRGFTTDNPYAAQYHLYDNTQPENLGLLERIRGLMDRYPGTTTVGEIGCENQLEVTAQYTAGDRRLHMAYSFELLTDSFSPEQVRGVVEALPGDCWPCWAIGNHDVTRVASRWAGARTDRAAFARLLNALLLSLRGTVCSYQGEELGLTEADLPHEALRDPYGIAFWPTFKGRDGCRTPMPWTPDGRSCGFSSGEPWLPVPPDHRPLAVSVQEHDAGSTLNGYRAFLRFRRAHRALRHGSIRFLDAPAGTLCFLRRHRGTAVVCAFNFGDSPSQLALPRNAEVVPLDGHGFPAAAPWRDGVTVPPSAAFFGSVGGADA
jgi:alpha-glucosidase